MLKGLSDITRDVRIQAARLARISSDHAFLEPLVEMMGMSRLCRIAAVQALVVQDISKTFKVLQRAANDSEAEVAIPAFVRLLQHSVLDNETTWQLGDAFSDTPLSEICFQDFTSVHDIPLDLLLVTLDSQKQIHVSAAAHMLALKATRDPRARERLIRMADSHATPDRIIAVHALARVGDRTAPDLLSRVIRSDDLAEHQLRLQEAAQLIGQPVAPMLARRLGSTSSSGAAMILSVIRSLPYVDSVPSLLHALEESCDERLFVHITNTLYIGGVSVQSAIADALRHSERGLLVPGLRYKANFPKQTDLPLILELYEHHPALRPLLLNQLEGFGVELRWPR